MYIICICIVSAFLRLCALALAPCFQLVFFSFVRLSIEFNVSRLAATLSLQSPRSLPLTLSLSAPLAAYDSFKCAWHIKICMI